MHGALMKSSCAIRIKYLKWTRDRNAHPLRKGVFVVFNLCFLMTLINFNDLIFYI
jgi:hypothetical protein